MKVLSVLAITLASSAFAAKPAPPPRPNIVLMLADDLGYGDLGCHGNPHVKTPNLDTLAREGIEFTHFRVNPACSPTRAALMTGRYPFRSGVSHVYDHLATMDPAAVTIAEALRGAGYATGLFGKWHLGGDRPTSANEQGFDEVLTFPGPALKPGGYFDMTLWRNNKREPQKGYCMDVFTDAAIQWLKANREKPFFLYFPANLIHTPIEVPGELVEKHDGLTETTDKIYAMTRSLDNNLGRLRAALKDLGLEENTLFIFTSDNGPCSSSKPFDRHMAGLHGLKGTVYENGIRVPCFLRWPSKVKQAGQVAYAAADIDVMPTILDACGVPVPAGVKFDGRSLLPLFLDSKAAWPERTLFVQHNADEPHRGESYAVFSGRWKLVQPCAANWGSYVRQVHRDRPRPTEPSGNPTYTQLCKLQGRGERTVLGPPRYELYDTVADPGETKDLAAAHPDVVESLKQQYETWFTDVTTKRN
jgi:arylsulfatase/arylsulfatase A